MQCRMKTIVCFLAIARLLSGAVASRAQTISPEWVFVRTPQIWESSTPDAEVPTRVSPTVVVVLYPNGDYAAVSGLLVEQASGKITISNDGYVVRAGTWKQDGDKITASGTVVFRTRRSATGRPDKMQTKQFIVKQVNGQKRLQELGGETYEHLKQFDDFANLER